MIKSDILLTLLSSFKSRLSTLEHNSKSHLDMIKSTSIITHSVADLCITIQTQLKAIQVTKSKQPSISARGSISNSIIKPTGPIFRSKTPLTNRNSINKKISIRSNTTVKDCQSHRSSKANLIKPKELNSNKKTNSFCSPIKKSIHHNLSKTDLNSKGGSKTQTMKMYNLAKKSSKASLTSKTSTEFSKGIIFLKKSPSNLKKIVKKKIPIPQRLDDSIGRIFSSDPKFMYEKEDPLLIGPISDINFISTSMINHIETPTVNKEVIVSNWITQCNIEDFHEDYLPFISIYLDKKELIKLMLVGKTYRKMVKKLLLAKLDKEKGNYAARLELFSNDIVAENEAGVVDMDKLRVQFSKGTLKAVSLLNESLLNKLFVENHLPSEDILLIYYVYFQLIGHKLSFEKSPEVFWRKCSEYYLKAPEGKTGTLIQNDMINKTNFSIDNIKTLIDLVQPNISKITPSYFSKMCGTTGLVVFFIKDVLDYIGITNDKKLQGQAYLTFKGLVKQIERKIDKLRK